MRGRADSNFRADVGHEQVIDRGMRGRADFASPAILLFRVRLASYPLVPRTLRLEFDFWQPRLGH